MKKAPDAFRTISEVSDILNTPAHVLRFWESKFYQIRPVKRAGGRRYYRPDDVALINGVRHLLQDQGMTIRGVQRILQENGIKHVTALGTPLPTATEAEVDAETVDAGVAPPTSHTAKMPVSDSVTDAEIVEGASEDAQRLETPDEVEIEQPPAASTAPADTTEDRVVNLGMAPSAPSPAPEVDPDNVTEVAAATASLKADIEEKNLPSSGTDGQTSEGAEPKLPQSDETVTTVDLPQIDPSSLTGDAPLRPSFASQLRSMPRPDLGPEIDSYARLSRRIEALLDRMSEASGAGRW